MPAKTAQRNHDAAVPRPCLTLAHTDPELIEYFDNFAFDEVLAHDDLDPRTRLMVSSRRMIACQALGEYRVMLGAALTVGVTPVEAKEIVYQAVPYVGMAKVFDFLHATNDVLTERGVAAAAARAVDDDPGDPLRERASRCRSRSSAPTGSTRSTPTHQRTSSTSSGGCRPTASATTSPAAASTSPPANCSPSRCSPPSAAASRNWPDTSPRTSTSATTAACW